MRGLIMWPRSQRISNSGSTEHKTKSHFTLLLQTNFQHHFDCRPVHCILHIYQMQQEKERKKYFTFKNNFPNVLWSISLFYFAEVKNLHILWFYECSDGRRRCAHFVHVIAVDTSSRNLFFTSKSYWMFSTKGEKKNESLSSLKLKQDTHTSSWKCKIKKWKWIETNYPNDLHKHSHMFFFLCYTYLERRKTHMYTLYIYNRKQYAVCTLP